MPLYLNTLNEPVLAIGICDRCRCKFPLMDLLPDPNTPGLRVCAKDRDVYDPWRLPAIQPDKITLPFVRPDVPIGTQPPVQNNEIISTETPQGIAAEDGGALVTEDSDQ